MAASLIKQIRVAGRHGMVVEGGWQTEYPGAIWDDITPPRKFWTKTRQTEVSRFGNNPTISSAARTRRFEAGFVSQAEARKGLAHTAI